MLGKIWRAGKKLAYRHICLSLGFDSYLLRTNPARAHRRPFSRCSRLYVCKSNAWFALDKEIC